LNKKIRESAEAILGVFDIVGTKKYKYISKPFIALLDLKS